MPKYITLQVNEPCHENWDNMNPNEQGRFCNSCQKSVVDFTTMTDTQVLNFFKLNKENTCGRFYDDQLNKPITIPRKEIPWLKYFFTITLPAFLFSLKASAQKKIEKTEVSPTKNIINPGNSYMGVGDTIYDSTSYKQATRAMKQGEVWYKPNAIENLKVLPTEKGKSDSSSKAKFKDFVKSKITPFPKTENCKTDVEITNKPKEQLNQLFGAVSIVRSNEVFFAFSDLIKPKPKTNSFFVIYPNPVPQNFILNLSFTNDLIGEIILEIFNSNGSLVKKENRTFEVKIKNTFILTNNLS
jgi:hypothetical protein